MTDNFNLKQYITENRTIKENHGIEDIVFCAMESYLDEKNDEEVMKSIADIKYGLELGEVTLAKDIFTYIQRETAPELHQALAKHFLKQYTTGVNIEDIIN